MVAVAKLLMRFHAAIALALLAACGSDRPQQPRARTALAGTSYSGPDALVLRLARNGGVARVFLYPRLDSALWHTSDAVPALDRVLAFDDDAGLLAFIDTHGTPGRIDFRLGTASLATHRPVTHAVSADGSAIFAVGADGSVLRFTPSGDWSLRPQRPARELFPQRDGSVFVVSGRDRSAVLWKFYPPETRIRDSITFPSVWRALRTEIGDRLYLAVDSGLINLRTRPLRWGPSVRFGSRINAVVSTPSGDRVYVATASSRTLSVVDRYQEKITGRIALPGQPADLRMDPLGRYLLVRMDGRDSVWVVAIGTGRVIGTAQTGWRADLPFVASDGALALEQGNDVAFLDGETLAPRQRVSGGAGDFWFAFHWNGLRPRAAALDEPVSFNLGAADSIRTDSDAVAADLAAKAAAARTGVPDRADTVNSARGPTFLVSFAALLSESRARELAAQIRVDGNSAHVLMSGRDATPIFRVVLGPYATRAEADRVGRDSHQTYWVYQDFP
jgi:hypothetical protein